MVPAVRTPDQIAGGFLTELVSILIGYKKVRESVGWDAYAARLGVDTRETLSEILAECRRNGFRNPRVHNSVIYWDYVCYPIGDKGKTQNPCCLCERDCDRRDWKGILIQEPCWRVTT